MARKSTVKRLPDEVRRHLERRLREDRLTLDELIDDLQEHFPNTQAPSRSALHRYRANFDEMAGRMREIEAASTALVGELGEDVGERAGQLLAQAVTTLATNAALQAHSDDVSITEIGKLARAAKAAMEARTLSRKEREAIEQAVRERLLREQDENLQEIAKAQGMDESQVDFWRRKFLGIGT
ncbi:phage protein Gp27 family protein [Castellaniella caeni]|uniref:phage protein Gp27 family protein n=1 Tax=Castellaniella caeni TaxID=266123 RepID=UPI000C9F33E2|nr:phage protein Gp27 family protein [Castellaniella caeni]